MKNFASDRRGATAIEYALMASLISMVVITVISTLGTTLSSSFFAAVAAAP
ncbi:MAG TPA: Flp family type IVb pilin [Rhizomicrobium sp.]|nr:Flp family type IVb pilin [Rhizomicrobium sp.]